MSVPPIESTPRTMTAVVQTAYGLDHIVVAERPVPEPGPGQVRLRVEAASINPADWHLATGTPAMVRLTDGLRRPKAEIVGRDVCGIVNEVGPEVTEIAVGDRLFGLAAGGFAQYAVADVERLAAAPASMSARAAAALPVAGVTALQAVELGNVAGKRVVVNGASGGVGHFAIQVAKAAGAATVAGVCSHRNVELVRSLGADRVFDYELEDFTCDEWDVVIDCVGSRSGGEIRRCLAANGTWVTLGAENKDRLLGPVPLLVARMARWRLGSRSMKLVVADETAERLARLADMVRAGELRSEISTVFTMRNVRDAFDVVESGRARGKLALDVADSATIGNSALSQRACEPATLTDSAD